MVDFLQAFEMARTACMLLGGGSCEQSCRAKYSSTVSRLSSSSMEKALTESEARVSPACSTIGRRTVNYLLATWQRSYICVSDQSFGSILKSDARMRRYCPAQTVAPGWASRPTLGSAWCEAKPLTAVASDGRPSLSPLLWSLLLL